MAENKKSFTAYCDWKDTFNSLPDDKAGQLIKHLMAYVNDENPHTDDILINAVFAQMKATLKRDLKKWEAKRDKNRDNARKRWDKKNANVCERIKNDANDAVSVSVSVSDSVSNNNINSAEVKTSTPNIDFIKLLDYINTQTQRTGKSKFKVINKKVKAKYKARLKDGYTNENIANAIKNSVKDKYHKENNYKYLTPEFFSRSEIIDKHGFKTESKKTGVTDLKNFISNPYKNI